jgi:hypothetical protein
MSCDVVPNSAEPKSWMLGSILGNAYTWGLASNRVRRCAIL